MRFASKIFFLFSLAFGLGGCTYYNGTYAALSDRPITLYTLTTNKKWNIANNIEANTSDHSWLYISTEYLPTLEDSVAQILDEHMGDYLTNARVEYRGFHIMWIYHYASWRVKGDVIRVYQ